MAAQLENFLVKLINAVVLAVVVGSLLFVDFTGRGRLWDTLRGVQKQETASLTAPDRANVQQAEGSDRVMVAQEQPAAAEPAPQQAARPAEPTAAQLADQVPQIQNAPQAAPRRLTSSLSRFDDPSRRAGTQTSASIDGSAYQQAPSAAPQAPAGTTYTAEMPADEQQAKAIAARYARSSRAEMMGRAAGPVYNLKGNKAGAPAPNIGELAAPGQ